MEIKKGQRRASGEIEIVYPARQDAEYLSLIFYRLFICHI
jgi:hypothetical protein